jgi:hypothetical protein
MTKKVSALRQGSFHLSHMVFRCDVRNADSTGIPLGVLAEISLSDYRVFGMAVRKALTTAEIDLLPATWRRDLVQPVPFFTGEFFSAWKEAQDTNRKAIDILASRHWTSLFVEPPQPLKLTPALRTASDDNFKRDTTAELLSTLMDRAHKYLHKPTVELDQTLKAA